MKLPEITLLAEPALGDDPRTWLEATAQSHGCQYLLAQAEDGVIWGRFDNGELLTSHDAFPRVCRAALRTATLWEARLFSEQAEVLLWRDGDRWRARVIDDGSLAPVDYIGEDQILWGTQAEDQRQGFSLLADGTEGLRHAVPLAGISAKAFGQPGEPKRPVRLAVRHYGDYDSNGNARIALSRLAGLSYHEDDDH